MQNHDESEETAYTHTWIPAIKCFHFNTLEMACYPLRLRFLNSNNIHQSFLRAISEIALFSTETKRFLSILTMFQNHKKVSFLNICELQSLKNIGSFLMICQSLPIQQLTFTKAFSVL